MPARNNSEGGPYAQRTKYSRLILHVHEVTERWVRKLGDAEKHDIRRDGKIKKAKNYGKNCDVNFPPDRNTPISKQTLR